MPIIAKLLATCILFPNIALQESTLQWQPQNPETPRTATGRSPVPVLAKHFETPFSTR